MTDLNTQKKLQTYRANLNEKRADYRTVLSKLKDEYDFLLSEEDDLNHTIEAQKIVQEVAQSLQRKAHLQIASVVSRCLQSVFEDDAPEFRIEFEKKRGKTEALLAFVRSSGKASDPVDESSGGMMEVAAFALRLACLVLSKPRKRRVLFLDEPFKSVHSPQWRINLVRLIESLAKEMSIQFVIITGVDDYKMGKVIEF